MKTLVASIFAAALLVSGPGMAQQAGAGANVGPVGAGASAGSQGVGVGAHVGPLGANLGVGFHPYYHHRVCRGGWYWHHHHRYCRRW